MPLKKKVLYLDALIDLVLGVLLLWFPKPIIGLLGAPVTDPPFYASILGGVLIGVALALAWEAWRKPDGRPGVGIIGAMLITACGALTLLGWLVWGGLTLPLQGTIILWALAIALLGLSVFELVLELIGGKQA